MRLALPLVLLAAPALADDVTVFAAASLKGPLDEVVAAWTDATGVSVRISYGATSSLARQIEAGAPAEVFVSASEDWMDAVAAQVVDGSRVDLLGNALVLVAPGEAGPIDLAYLPTALGEGRLAMALVDAVPAGQYGRAALTSLGLWDQVRDRVIEVEDVRAVLRLVERDEVAYGVVYATDARASDAVSVVASFPADSHPPIVYPAALVVGADADAAAFLDFLSGAEADAIFAAAGFEVPD